MTNSCLSLFSCCGKRWVLRGHTAAGETMPYSSKLMTSARQPGHPLGKVQFVRNQGSPQDVRICRSSGSAPPTFMLDQTRENLPWSNLKYYTSVCEDRLRKSSELWIRIPDSLLNRNLRQLSWKRLLKTLLRSRSS